jgi:FkbM family methyltransferase
MTQLIKDKRSLKVKLVDGFFSILFNSIFLKEKLKIIADRAMIQYTGYEFSYNSNENGEIEFINYLSRIYKNKSFRFFDVGAHHGTYTAMILDVFKEYTGELFEPTPLSFNKLKENYYSNNHLTLHNSALSNFTGEADFINYPDDPTRNGLGGVGKEVTFFSEDLICHVVRGDEFCQSQNIEGFELLKIDAEGHDFNVIKGFEKLIVEKAIDIIQFEYTFKHADLGVPLRKYYDFFKVNGYSIGPIRKNGIDFYESFDPRFNEYQFGPNYVAVKFDLVEKFREFI